MAVPGVGHGLLGGYNLRYAEAAVCRCSSIYMFLKIYRKTPVSKSLFFNKVAGLCNFIKKKTLTQVFSCKFCEILRTPHLKKTSGRLLLDMQMN